MQILKIILNQYLNLLERYGYRIYVLFHRAPADVLERRIHARGEELYRTEGYYRTFNPAHLPTVISLLEENLTNYIIPLVSSGKIEGCYIVE